MNNWKTKAQGLLSAFSLTIGPLSGFLAAVQLIQSQQPGHGPANYTIPILLAALTAAGAIAKAWIGYLQNDGKSAAEIGQIAALSVNSDAQPQAKVNSQTSGQKLGAFALIALLLKATLIIGTGIGLVSMTGCTAGQAKSFADAFIASAQAVVNADPNAVYVPDLNLAIAAMKTAEAGWDGSSINCALTSAANTAVQIIDSILPASPVALIATVAVAGFDALAAALFPCVKVAAPSTLAMVNIHSLRNSSPTYSTARQRIGQAWVPTHTYKAMFNQAARDSGLAVRI
jgi:hypothetical protein